MLRYRIYECGSVYVEAEGMLIEVIDCECMESTYIVTREGEIPEECGFRYATNDEERNIEYYLNRSMWMGRKVLEEKSFVNLLPKECLDRMHEAVLP